jgi:hypothetical protein
MSYDENATIARPVDFPYSIAYTSPWENGHV